MRSTKPVSRVFGLIVLSVVFALVNYHRDDGGPSWIGSDERTTFETSRRLQKFVILDEDCDDYFDSHGGLVAYLLGICYLFVGLSVICETYFHESLGHISEKLKLPEDIAGATFMAAGSSSPELFTSLIALFGVSNDMGVGTVVGSAIFNLLVIVGGSGIVSPTILCLDWKPIVRDVAFNVFSFLYLVWVFWDGQVTWYEALIGAAGYVGYVFVIAINQYVLRRMEKTSLWIKRIYDTRIRKRTQDDFELGAVPIDLDAMGEEALVGSSSSSDTRVMDADEYVDEEDEDGVVSVETVVAVSHAGGSMEIMEGFDHRDISFSPREEEDETSSHHHEDTHHGGGKARAQAMAVAQGDVELSPSYDAPQPNASESDSLHGKLWARTKRAFHIFMKWLKLPYEFAFKWTVPNMTHPRIPLSYLVAFFICISWIALISWTMVEFATKVGCILKFNQAIVGLTLLAIGTSLPDCLASLAVAREGKGNMAVCNALGSNVFDILFCLGFPWVLSTILSGGQPVVVKADELVKYVIILFVTMIGVLCGFVLNKWRLDSKVGAGFVSFYVVLLLYFLMEEIGNVPYI